MKPLSVYLALALFMCLHVIVVAQSVPKTEQPSKKTPAEIEAIIDQLVFAEGKAKGGPVFSPGVNDNRADYRKRYEACQNAFKQLGDLEEQGLPYLIAHLKDERSSINFRNHHLGNSVGDACYWNIYFQLQDRPEDYSSYGWGRKGIDGQNHEKPYWAGTPFDEAGGVDTWLEANKALSYREKQIKCLRWLLAKEQAIGAPDADSYFENILPLEVRILQRRVENGEPVKDEWLRLKKVLEKKDASQIPTGVLPDKPKTQTK